MPTTENQRRAKEVRKLINCIAIDECQQHTGRGSDVSTYDVQYRVGLESFPQTAVFSWYKTTQANMREMVLRYIAHASVHNDTRGFEYRGKRFGQRSNATWVNDRRQPLHNVVADASKLKSTYKLLRPSDQGKSTRGKSKMNASINLHAAAAIASEGVVLLRVVFDDHGKEYTYLGHESQNLKEKDLVVVPVNTSKVDEMTVDPTEYTRVVRIDKIEPIENLEMNLEFKPRFILDTVKMDFYEQCTKSLDEIAKTVNQHRNANARQQVLASLGFDSPVSLIAPPTETDSTPELTPEQKASVDNIADADVIETE